MKISKVTKDEGKYEAMFKCQWCGEVPLKDSEVEIRLNNDTLGKCPKCNRFSYANGIRAKFKVNTKNWRFVYGSSSQKEEN